MEESHIITFEEAIRDSQGTTRNLLLGNGFSIAYNRIFQYTSLYEEANEHIDERINNLFRSENTTDFEIILEILQKGGKALTCYCQPGKAPQLKNKINENIKNLKMSLITTIKKVHPKYPETNSRLESCCNFLSNFIPVKKTGKKTGKIYTLNYDLLLYWVLMSDRDNGKTLSFNDGFCKRKDTLIWRPQAEAQNIFYLHGALHIFDGDIYPIKLERDPPLLEQIESHINQDNLPIFVSEGEYKYKLEKINNHSYLRDGYENFSSGLKNNENSLFIFGVSFSPNDNHILKEITHGNFSQLFVSIKGSLEENEGLIKKVKRLCQRSNKHPIEYKFYNADSAKVWGDVSNEEF